MPQVDRINGTRQDVKDLSVGPKNHFFESTSFTEIEHGFTDRLQGSLYLNAISHDISGVTDFTNRDRLVFLIQDVDLRVRYWSANQDVASLRIISFDFVNATPDC